MHTWTYISKFLHLFSKAITAQIKKQQTSGFDERVYRLDLKIS